MELREMRRSLRRGGSTKAALVSIGQGRKVFANREGSAGNSHEEVPPEKAEN